MRKQDALALACAAAIVVTSGLYVAEPETLIYYPLERAWRWQKTPGIAMFWYGRSLFALAAGVITFLVARPLFTRLATSWDEAPPAWLPKLISWATLGALLAALGHTVLHEYWNWMR